MAARSAHRHAPCGQRVRRVGIRERLAAPASWRSRCRHRLRFVRRSTARTAPPSRPRARRPREARNGGGCGPRAPTTAPPICVINEPYARERCVVVAGTGQNHLSKGVVGRRHPSFSRPSEPNRGGMSIARKAIAVPDTQCGFVQCARVAGLDVAQPALLPQQRRGHDVCILERYIDRQGSEHFVLRLAHDRENHRPEPVI